MKIKQFFSCFSAVLLCCGILIAHADAESSAPTSEIKALLAAWDKLNDKCRGGSGDDKKTWEACDEREKKGGQLQARGWCYGEPGQAGYQMQWHACKKEQVQSVEAISSRNNGKLVVTWTTLKPGQKDKSGFALTAEGALSYAGTVLQPRVKVQDDQGQLSNLPPSEVRISPPSPSGKWAFMTACEPKASESNLCAFQFLLDMKSGKLHELYWTKYGQPAHVWWAKDEAYALIPISQEGDTWLSVVDIKKRDSRDVQMYDFVKQAEGALQCKLSENEPAYVLDLDSIEWPNGREVHFTVAVLCEQPAQLRSLKGLVDVPTGNLRLLQVDNPPHSAPKAKTSFDCSKAASAVEKMICGNGELAGLDEKLGQLYKQAVNQSKNSDLQKEQQINWLRQVRNKCTTVDCLANAYRLRINELQRSF
ncbi:lysozyme inhibitor LprI family protein [Candidatus Magnetaquicoccus inordinatus]|uniref:lysozyme inhibitor LprI family protein n=1 Tax=Candidatus Magnetaquicoccus inordinatus TaxID=2496818 RepID=UPI00102B900D|nr:lysozyme inhibitor LprI family protein [Candidatus Magnetaquicoccus inordinatus]